ncbi:positive regulation of renal water transport [Desmophyllum pertusum]|uniref:Positive regulation of renal water transport n=1 Tax=Desmophyllum pertusum TaxID=174260 RepID=A0A9X0D749_9CNID|nr:positive regulation of renal water transport [Desmophyllum pertusum]
MSLRVHVCTWNVKVTQPPDEDFRSFLHLDNEEQLPDIVAVGLQEVDAKPQSLLIEYIKENSWVKILQAYLGAYGLVKLKSIRMLGMVHLVAVHTKHLPFVREIRPGYCKTALLGLLGTKGAVSLRFTLYGQSFCFINSHFSAHAEYEEQRNLVVNPEFESISQNMLYANCTPQKAMEHSFYKVKKAGKCFVNFHEGELTFPPTYKYNPGTDEWDTESGKYRKPAWTDRVLWQESEEKKNTVRLESYTSHQAYQTSDHRPVGASLVVELNDSLSSMEDPMSWKLDLMSLPWYGNEDGLCVYVVKNYKTYSWDWIGLYRVGFQHVYDYEMYEWAVGDGDEYGENGCAVLFDCLPEEAGHYVMCYYSYKLDCIISVSDPFEILPPRDEDKDPVEVQVEQPTEDV